MSNLATKIEAAKHQVFFQHNPQTTKGYITIAKKENGSGCFRQFYYQPQELVDHLTSVMGEDVFYSQNTFYRRSRRIETIKQLRSLYVDLDYYHFNFKTEWILAKLEREYYRRTIPEPNMIIFSGQGIVLIWTIEPVPYTVLPLWQAIQNYLIQQLKDLGGDPKAADAARIFRLAGSTSSKNGNEVRVEYRHGYQYTLREIQYEYLPELTPKQKVKKGRKKKIVHLFNLYTLHNARIRDLDKLVTLRNGEMTGHRETTLFLYRFWSCCFTNDPETALQQTLEFNENFKKPLSKKEVEKATASAQKAWEARSDKESNARAQSMGYPGAGYRISNRKIIEWLEITEEEQSHLKTIIGKKEKQRRNTIAKRESRRAEGIKTREEYIQAENQKTQTRIEALRKTMEENPGLSNRETAKLAGISEAYVRKLKTRL